MNSIDEVEHSRNCASYTATEMMEIGNYSSSLKDCSGWTGLHTPSKADTLCVIPPRAPRLRVHRTGSRGGAKARRAEAQRSQVRLDGAAPVAASGHLARCGRPGQGSTYLRTAIHFGLHSAGSGPLVQYGRPRQGSTYLRTTINGEQGRRRGRRHLPVPDPSLLVTF